MAFSIQLIMNVYSRMITFMSRQGTFHQTLLSFMFHRYQQKKSVVLSSGLSSGLFIIAMGHQRLFIFRSPVLIFGRVLSLHVLLTFGPVRFLLSIFLSPSELPSANFLVAPQCQVTLYVDVGQGLRLQPCLTAILETVDQPDIRVCITLINLSRLMHLEKALAS